MPLAGLLFTACAGTYESERVDPGKEYQGVFYSLPRTVIVLDLPITIKTVQKPKRCQDSKGAWWATLGIDPPDSNAFGTRYSLGDVAITSRPEPDPGQAFVIKPSGSVFQNKELELKLAELGLITNASLEAKDRTLEFAVKTFEVGAKVTGTLLRAAIFGFGASAPGATATADQCTELANEAVTLRNKRVDLLAGASARNAPPSLPADTLDRMLKELDAIERGLLANFTGAVTVKRTIVRCSLRPALADLDKQGNLRLDLFDFSKNQGISLKPNVDCWVPPEVPSASGATDIKVVSATVHAAQDQYVARIRPQVEQAPCRSGFYYRIPAEAVVGVEHDAKAIAHSRLAVAQLGVVASLPHVRASRVVQTADFYGATGAIQRISVASETVDPTALTGVGTAAEEVIGAVGERRKERKRHSEDLAILENTRKILEERKKIRALGTELEESE